jgi:hypothetical protein
MDSVEPDVEPNDFEARIKRRWYRSGWFRALSREHQIELITVVLLSIAALERMRDMSASLSSITNVTLSRSEGSDAKRPSAPCRVRDGSRVASTSSIPQTDRNACVTVLRVRASVRLVRIPGVAVERRAIIPLLSRVRITGRGNPSAHDRQPPGQSRCRHAARLGTGLYRG